MLIRIFGKKIGMTQIFSDEGKSVPITVIGVKNLFVTQIKTIEKDGYSALQLGLLRDRYYKVSFNLDWCKKKSKYFLHLGEVEVDEKLLSNFKIGKELNLDSFDFEKNTKVKVSGNGIGFGFQGVVKRWGFAGGPSGHGSNFHRKPGSIGNMCSQGKVVKGKKLPGQYGGKKISVTGLKVVDLNKKDGYLFVKGAIPGKSGSLVVISKQG